MERHLFLKGQGDFKVPQAMSCIKRKRLTAQRAKELDPELRAFLREEESAGQRTASAGRLLFVSLVS